MRRHQTPYQPSSETSREAAIRARAFVGPQGNDVLCWLRSRRNGGTQIECHESTGISRQSLSPRFKALQDCGDIVRTDQKRGGAYVYVAAWRLPLSA